MTPRLWKILKLFRYYALTRSTIQQLAAEKNDRVVRRLIDQLVRFGFVRRIRSEVVNPSMGAATPVYVLTRKGAELLAAEVDPSYLHCCTATPQWTTLYHTVCLVLLHIALEQSIERQTQASLGRFVGEWDIVNPDAKEETDRCHLATLLREKPKLVCLPDAGFLLRVGAYAKAYYLELDRGTSGINQISNSKTPGYAELLKQQGHKKHFDSNMDTFSVLSVSLTPGRRDLLRAAMKEKAGAELWKFCSWDDFVAPERLLYEPIWFPCVGGPSPLIKRKEGPAVVSAGVTAPCPDRTVVRT